MKLCKTSELKGGEILAKDVMTPDWTVLLSAGVKIRPEYVSKMLEIGITEVAIKEPERNHEASILRDEVENELHEKVKTIMERHLYSRSSELKDIAETADNIISNVLEEEKMVEQVYDIRERSADLYEHAINVCSMATLTALKLGVPKEKVHDIAAAALLHDIGLRYLTFSFNNREWKEEKEPEYVEYRKHPVYGYVALKEETWLSDLAKQIILSHHERKNRSGYPLRSAEKRIEVGIVGVCDLFDEMICGIGCKQQKVYQAVEYLKAYNGISFDRKIVDTFLEFIAVYPVGSKVVLSNGQRGTVIQQNKEFPERPVIQLDAVQPDGSRPQENRIDLVKKNDLIVEKVLE